MRRRRGFSKSKPKTKDDLIQHFQKRARERGLGDVSKDFVQRINKMIRSYDTSVIEFYMKQTNARSIYRIIFGGDSYYLVYNKNLNCVTTVLTQDMVDQWGESENEGDILV